LVAPPGRSPTGSAAPRRRTVRTDGGPLMEFRLGERSDALREEVRECLREHFRPEMVERAHDSGTAHVWELYRALGAQGWIAASWPEEYGGQGGDPFEMTAMRGGRGSPGCPPQG